MTENTIICGDCLAVMRTWPDGCVDLVFGSPPYEDARTYSMDFKLKGQDWVDWMDPIFKESLRVCRGLVAFVIEGKTKEFRYSATPILLMADLHRAGVHLRKPPIFHRVGIPGSGGPDWLRNDYEFVVCATSGGKLPWSDNKAMGHPPKYEQGGLCSNRHADGRRANRQRYATNNMKTYAKPKIANPGNVIKCHVGKGHMGSDLAHEGEAPFPEKLAEFFILSFCPPQGVVYDPFSGSGTTIAVAEKNGRNWIASDIRQSQVDLSKKRIIEAREQLSLFHVPGGTPVSKDTVSS